MRKPLWTMIALVAVLTIPAAYAQLSSRLVAEIPFGFIVGNEALPAGEYEVSGGPSQGTLLIRAEDRSAQVYAVAIPVRAAGAVEEGKLMFNRYGNQYFLTRIWAPGAGTGAELRKTKAEREMANNAAGRDTVEVAVRLR